MLLRGKAELLDASEPVARPTFSGARVACLFECPVPGFGVSTFDQSAIELVDYGLGVTTLVDEDRGGA
jgi:hypothetical protein